MTAAVPEGDEDAPSEPTVDELDQQLAALGVDVTPFAGIGVDAGATGSPVANGEPSGDVPAGASGTRRSLPGRRRRPQPLPRNFRLLWAATALSNLGDGLRLVALPLLATTITDDPRLIAGVTVAQRLPWLIFILPGGAWADRYDRRVLRMRLDVFRAAVMAGLVALILLDQESIVALFVVAALLSSAEAIVDSSSAAMVPATVDHADLERAIGRLGSTELAMNDLVGPPLGGLLFGLAVAVPFGVDGITFAAAALVMGLMTGSFTGGADRAATPGGRSSMRSELGEGFRWLWNQQLLRTLAVVSTVLGTASFISAAVFVIFATDELGLSEFGFGLLLVPAALGGIGGSLIAPRFRRFSLRATLPCAVLGAGVATWAMSIVGSPVLVGLLSAVAQASVMVWNVLTLALRQRLIPNELLGRVGASYRFLVYLGMPFGALAGGLITNSSGVRAAIFVSGSVLVFAGVVLPIVLRGLDEYERATRTAQ